MTRATKIVATLGPASSEPAVLEQLLRAGVDTVRLNFSHGTAQDHIDRAKLVRDTATRVGKPVALMADLQGPKIRVGKFADGKVTLKLGESFVLDASRTEPGDVQAVGQIRDRVGRERALGARAHHARRDRSACGAEPGHQRDRDRHPQCSAHDSSTHPRRADATLYCCDPE